MPGKFENPHYPHDSEYLDDSTYIIERGSLLFWRNRCPRRNCCGHKTDFLITHQKQGDIVRHDSQDINDIHPIFQKLPFVGRPSKSEEILEGKPWYAHWLNKSQLRVVHWSSGQVLSLEGLHGIQGHTHCGDNHKEHTDGRHPFGSNGCIRLLNEIPQELLMSSKSACEIVIVSEWKNKSVLTCLFHSLSSVKWKKNWSKLFTIPSS